MEAFAIGIGVYAFYVGSKRQSTFSSTYFLRSGSEWSSPRPLNGNFEKYSINNFW